MIDFLDQWLNHPKKIDWRDLSRRTIRSDKWDEQDLDTIFKVMPDFRKARDVLSDTVDTANGATADTFFSFFKGMPQNLEATQVRPDYLINAFVRDELQQMSEWEELRALGTVGDDVSAALAFVTMEKDLEILFDKVKTEQQQAEQLSKQMQELSQLEAESESIEDLLSKMDAQRDENGDLPDGMDDSGLKAQAQQNAEVKQSLEESIEALGDELRDSLDAKTPGMKQNLRDGIKKARDEAKTLQDMNSTWGTEPGAMQKLDAQKRLELAKRIKNAPKLKRLSELVGPMKRVMFAEQRKQSEHARDEIFNVEKGADLSRVLPSMLMYFKHPRLKRLFYRKLAERSLLQYELKGTDKLGMGGIVCAIDNSGSMAGDNEIWAKAVALSLMHLARSQDRSFKGIHFGSANEFKEFDFLKPEDFSMERIFEFAELFFGGGTDFYTPLAAAVKHLRGEYDATGVIHGDILLITDGDAPMDDKFLKDLHEEQEKLGFQIFGVLIGKQSGYSRGRDTLERICQGRVVDVRSLTGPDDVRDVFGQIHSF
jgi:uncharacterized protein with von Willebrand factor type A (vWA) domain